MDKISIGVAMSCWVVPTLAAEYWGVSLNHVLNGIDDGTITSKIESGFVLVSVSVDTEAVAESSPPPPTFAVVTSAEREALEGANDGEDALESVDFEIEAKMGDWRDARRVAGDRRRAPSINSKAA